MRQIFPDFFLGKFLEKFQKKFLEKKMGENQSYSHDEIGTFIDRWRPQLLYRNFSQIWTDTETGEDIDFSKIADIQELEIANIRAESQYLKKIALRRERRH